MGTLKQTLPWPQVASPSETVDQSRATTTSTIISSAFDAIAPFCDRVFVVVGRDAEAVLGALSERSFTRVDVDSDDEMFASIRAGLSAIVTSERQRSTPFDAILLQPGDHPGVARTTVQSLFASLEREPTRAVMPEHGGKGGHPALLPRSLIDQILAYTGAGGLRRFWIDHPGWRVRVTVDDPQCVIDLDTPVAYSQAIKQHRRGCA